MESIEEKNDNILKEYYKNRILKIIEKINYINRQEKISMELVVSKLEFASIEYYIQLLTYFKIMYYALVNPYHHIYDDYLEDFGKGRCLQ